MIDRGTFVKQNQNGVAYYTIPFLNDTGLVCTVYSTRQGGVSTGETAAMNLGMRRRDTPDNVMENYRRLLRCAETTPERAVVTQQVHGTQILRADLSMGGKGIRFGEPAPEADGLMTDVRGAALIKHSADCATIYLLDPVKKAIALAHSGWRGTLADMAGHAVEALRREYGSDPGDCMAAVAPSIGPCCFEVGEDVTQLFADAYPRWDLVRRGAEKPHVDLWACLDAQLIRAGLRPENIRLSGVCTCCHPDEFHSHRHSRGHCGLMAAVFELK
ncbi:MAG: peptidoglycan editing factor PgeF [Eubacteriales bacterium]|nr:peptidoglycan editing factor PgeF [Eubacteriales bacterium]